VEDVTPVVLRRALREGLVPISICQLLARANVSSFVKGGMTCLGSAIVDRRCVIHPSWSTFLRCYICFLFLFSSVPKYSILMSILSITPAKCTLIAKKGYFPPSKRRPSELHPPFLLKDKYNYSMDARNITELDHFFRMRSGTRNRSELYENAKQSPGPNLDIRYIQHTAWI